MRTLHSADGWTPQTLVDRMLPALQPSFAPLDRAREVFAWDAI
jgi:hypothetical protein